MDDSGRARIVDFGDSIVIQDLDSIRSASSQHGHTPRWTAPEVLREGTYSKESDIFSFAMVTIEVRVKLCFTVVLHRYRHLLARFLSAIKKVERLFFKESDAFDREYMRKYDEGLNTSPIFVSYLMPIIHAGRYVLSRKYVRRSLLCSQLCVYHRCPIQDGTRPEREDRRLHPSSHPRREWLAGVIQPHCSSVSIRHRCYAYILRGLYITSSLTACKL